jgi:hypothetical protein
MACAIELEIGAASGPGEFTTRVVNSPSGGKPSAVVQLDVDELLRDRDALELTVLASAVPGRGVVPAHEERLRRVGRLLFDALFSGPVLDTYRASVATARASGEALRVVLRLADPHLAALPWEAMFDSETEAYICRREALVRLIPAPYTPEQVPVNPPLRVLVLVASPQGMPSVDIDAERTHLAEALAAPIAEGLIELSWLLQASWQSLHESLLSGQWHVLHFIGYRDYDLSTDQGLIALVNEDGRADLVDTERLADLLHEARPTPRLVVLSSCSSGQQGTHDLFSGSATTLIRNGISAVAAMQFSASDSAANAFARGFYTAIAHGRSVDDATRSGRIEILATSPGTLEWVTPVLHIRGDATQLFHIMPASGPPSSRSARPFDTSQDLSSDTQWADGPDARPASREKQTRQGIFLCYRREDSRHQAGRLADALASRFGDRSVFMDVDHLRIGNWRKQIDQSLEDCAAVIVVIGPQWLATLKQRSASEDQVRYEVAQALLLDKIIVPVAVDRAPLPHRGELPEDIAPLNDAQAYELGVDVMWRPTVGKLLDDLAELLRHS